METVLPRNLQAVQVTAAIGSITPNIAAARRIEIAPRQTGLGAQPAAIRWPDGRTMHDSRLADREETSPVTAQEVHPEQAIVRVEEEDWVAGLEREVAAPIVLAVGISPAAAAETAMHSVAVRVDMTVPVLARAVAADLRV